MKRASVVKGIQVHGFSNPAIRSFRYGGGSHKTGRLAKRVRRAQLFVVDDVNHILQQVRHLLESRVASADPG